MTEFEREFIDLHKLDMEKGFDAQGLKISKQRKLLMQIKDYHYAYNCPPCKENHTIQNKYGQCIVCSPIKIAIYKREHGTGYLYIAASCWGNWIKVGCTTNFE